MKTEIKTIGSLRTFLAKLEKVNFKNEKFYCYRGHSDADWELSPSIYRERGWIENEDNMLREIILHCPEEFRDCKTTFEHLVKMQHYSLPTRMLDLTQNPLVALYFACQKVDKKNTNGEVIIFEIPKGEIKYFDSDTVSVISNISRRPISFNIDGKLNLPKKEFNELQEIQLLLHEIRQEKPYFKSEIESKHFNIVKCVKPKLDNPRIVKQDGLFLLFGIDSSKRKCAKVPKEYLYDSSFKIIINRSKKEHILKQLSSFGISDRKLYPEITSVANDVKRQYKSEKKPIKLFLFDKPVTFKGNKKK